MTVYADNAATTKLSDRAFNKMLPYLKECYGNPSSLHTIGQTAADALAESRKRIASALNCGTNEIIFTSGGTEADNQAIISAANIGKKQNKMHIVSSAIEHHAVLETLKKLENEGFKITLILPDEKGIISPESVENAITDETALVSIMYANNELGTIEPIAEIGEACKKRGVIFHTDAVAAMGHTDIDLSRDNIDMLSFSAHKFHGPKGVGALYCRGEIEASSLISGGGQEKGRRAGTENVAAIVGMAEALCESLEADKGYVLGLRKRLEEGLLSIPDSKINGGDQRLPGTVNISFKNIIAESLVILLDSKGINISAGSACMSGSLEPSHVLTAIGLDEETAESSVRFSLSEYNSEEEIDYIINETTQIVKYLRSKI